MDLKELTDLIGIRDYVVNSVANPTISREQVRELNGMLILLDKKIVSILLGSEFKEYMEFKNVRQATEEVARRTNIKSSIVTK